MIFKHKDQRVAMLVDVQNLYYSAKHLFNKKVNFSEILKQGVAGRILTRAIAYVIKTDVVDKEKDFFEALNKIGFDVKTKDIQVFPGGAKKGDWDVGICMDAIRLGHKVDSMILVSGDGDYRPLVTYLQQSHGCSVEGMAFSKTTSHLLSEVLDDFIDLESSPKFLISDKRRVSNSKK